jgi:hypothetical protein
MVDETVSIRDIVTERLTKQSAYAVDAVKTKLEAPLSHLDSAILQHPQMGESELALQRIEAGPPLSLHRRMEVRLLAGDHVGLEVAERGFWLVSDAVVEAWMSSLK